MADVGKKHTSKKSPEICADPLIVAVDHPATKEGLSRAGRSMQGKSSRTNVSAPEFASNDQAAETPETKARALSHAEFKEIPGIKSLAYRDHLARLKEEESPLTLDEQIKLASFREFKDYPLIAELSANHKAAKSKGEQSPLSTGERALAWSYHEFRDFPSIRDLAYQDNVAELRGEKGSPLSKNDQERLEMYRTIKFDRTLVELAIAQEQGQLIGLEDEVRLNSHRKYGELEDPELRAWAFEEARARLEQKPNPLNDSQTQFMLIERNLNKKTHISMQRLDEARYWSRS